MKNFTAINAFNTLFIGVSVLGLTSVSLLSLYNPQATMDLVRVKLDNTDALSSIRGIYGGVGISIITALIYLWIKRKQLAVVFLALFWGSYAVSRLITIIVDGALGDFGNQWIVIETVLCIAGIILSIVNFEARNDKQ